MKISFWVIFPILLVVKADINSNEHLESAVVELIKEFNSVNQLHIHFMTPFKNFPSNNFFKKVQENLYSVSIGNKPQRRVQLIVIFNSNDFFVAKDVHEFYLIVLPVAKNLSLIFTSIWDRQNLLNLDVVMMQEKKIELFTFFPFSENDCNNTETIKVVNEFVNGTWKRENFFMQKISNFHGCKLRLGVPPAYPGTNKREHKNGTVEFYGSDIKIIFELAKRLNFVTKISFERNWGDAYENGSVTLLIAGVARKVYDFGAGWFFLSPKKAQVLDFIQPYFFVPIVVIVPPGN